MADENRPITKEEAEAIEAEWKKYADPESDCYFPAHPKVHPKGWEGVLSAGVTCARVFDLPWNDSMVQLLANCLLNYENFKELDSSESKST